MNWKTWLCGGAILATILGATPSTAADGALNWNDRRDFDFASRGFVATRKDPKITDASGKVVWDLSAYDFLKGEPPATVNPSLWRQASLLSKHGLFKVTDRVWQVRGFDIANTTFIQGDTGWIVIDTLTSRETAKAALDLVNEQLGPRKVVAIIYTHSHSDHFGGARGMVDQADLDAGKVKVIAPQGFLEHAVSENIIAGTAMARRAVYQFGFYLPKGTDGQVSAGIGQAVSLGSPSLLPPNVTITHTGETLTVDGVKLEFQMTPGTEAPAEMNVYLPDLRALCMAENANASQHNVLTPRGALVRDAKVWADDLTESLSRYGDKTDFLFTSHAWPRFGRETIVDYLSKHRDAYKYLHDQSVRMMNAGLTGAEIANRLHLPKVLDQEWFNRGYYGSLSFNGRAVYQRYMGWYDANPVHLDPFEPKDESQRYVAAMGGAKKVLGEMRAAEGKGDFKWAAELGARLVMADAKDAPAKAELAKVYRHLGFATENAIWRNMYLSAVQDLEGGPKGAFNANYSLDMVRATPTAMLMDLMAVRLNADRAGEGHAVVDLVFPERQEKVRLTVRNGVLLHEEGATSGPADATVTLARQDFLLMSFMGGELAAKRLAAGGGIKVEGDANALARLVGWLDPLTPTFPILWR
jgi:alkyl sulfatase BDS1-like metallo-beta-lactamase superfamily hydrolase